MNWELKNSKILNTKHLSGFENLKGVTSQIQQHP